jgi:hypothetical protein
MCIERSCAYDLFPCINIINFYKSFVLVNINILHYIFDQTKKPITSSMLNSSMIHISSNSQSEQLQLT